MDSKSEIILYQPDNEVRLEVRLEDETVWLTQTQISELFQRDRTVITKHIANIFKEKELEEKTNVHFLHFAKSDKPVKIYSLDIIISVGYRVKSQRGTQFRQWANKVLKEYLLKGYAVNQRLSDLENTVAEHSKKIDFFIRTSLPPVEGIFYDGQIFDAYAFATNLIRSAKKSIVLIDNYVDESVLLMLSKRGEAVRGANAAKPSARTFTLKASAANYSWTWSGTTANTRQSAFIPAAEATTASLLSTTPTCTTSELPLKTWERKCSPFRKWESRPGKFWR